MIDDDDYDDHDCDEDDDSSDDTLPGSSRNSCSSLGSGSVSIA